MPAEDQICSSRCIKRFHSPILRESSCCVSRFKIDPRLLPATAVWPEMLKRHASDAEALSLTCLLLYSESLTFEAVSSATAVDIAGPVQPAWCSTGASASSAPGSVEFIGRWFLNHVPQQNFSSWRSHLYHLCCALPRNARSFQATTKVGCVWITCNLTLT